MYITEPITNFYYLRRRVIYYGCVGISDKLAENYIEKSFTAY
jgi:hypothetical protein